MEMLLINNRLHHPQPSMLFFTQDVNNKLILPSKSWSLVRVHVRVHFDTAVHFKKRPKYLRYPRRTKLPPDLGNSSIIKRGTEVKEYSGTNVSEILNDKKFDELEEEDEHDVWGADEIDAISSLFQGRIPQKPGNLNRERPLPLPLPHKIRPLGVPTMKRQVRTSSSPEVFSRLSLSNQIYKDPVFLLNLAREIRNLPVEHNASTVLVRWGKFLRRGSLSLTIRELGHMGLPERALQTFYWTQKQSHLFPDDRTLAATVETLASAHELKLPSDMKKFTSLASRSVLEATVRGFIKAGRLNLAWRLLSVARNGKRMLGSSIYAKLILELGKNPDKSDLVINLLEELAERDSLELSPQDCNAIMKVCVRLGKFEFVECFFDWFQKSGNQPSVVMYTTMIHSRFSAKNYREAMVLVWEMERLDCLLDLPAYRVTIKVFVALNDLPRAVRYFSRMKEAGFSPTYDLYRDMITIYLHFGRLAKCKDICKEVELSGYKLDAELRSQLLEFEKNLRSSG